MAAIYLIRHGQASFGTDNYDRLTDLGKQQAAALGIHLQERGIVFDAAFMGAMKRHAETAEHCLASINSSLQPRIISGLNEYAHEEIFSLHVPALKNGGDITRYLAQFPNPRKTFQTEFEKAIERWRSGQFDTEYSETWQQFLNRCSTSLQQLQQQNAKSIAVFSSGGAIAAITGHIMGAADKHIMELSWAIMNCSITCLLFNEEKISLRYFNDFSHFETANRSLLTHR